MATRLQDNPALARPDWLPASTRWSELAELRDTHQRLLAARHEAGDEHAALRRRYEEEDEAHATALEAAYRDDGNPDKAPGVTPPEERQAKLQALDQRLKAATKALEAFLDEAIDTIREQTPEWLNDLQAEAAKAEAQRQEAARLLAEAEAEEARLDAMRRWLERTARDRLGWHIPFGMVAEPESPSTLEIANQGVNANA